MEKITEIQDIVELANRPPNIIDPILLELEEEIPIKENEYISLLYRMKPEILPEILDLQRNSTKLKEVRDVLLPENLKYAVKRVPAYRKLYEGINIDSIDSVDGLEELKTLTNELLRGGDKYPYTFAVEEKAVYDFQSMATTGPRKHTVYSGIDWAVRQLISASAFEEIGIKKGEKMLIFAPSYPHIFGPGFSAGAAIAGIHSVWKPVGRKTAQELLEEIKYVRPDVLLTVPHGPKGATGAMDVLVKEDKENVLEQYLYNKTVILGGIPLINDPETINLRDILVDDIGVKNLKNAYGTGEIVGWIDCDRSSYAKKAEGRLKYRSEVHEAPNWIFHPLESKDAPEGFYELGITVLGREAQPIIKFAPGDYAKFEDHECGLATRRITYICRREWFRRTPSGYTVSIPTATGLCVSEV